MNMAHEMLRIYTVRLNLHTYTPGCSRIGRNLPSRGLRGNFQAQAPREAYIWRGDLTERFLRYEFAGLIFGILR